VAVLLESGAWGASASGPIVRKILDVWLAEQGGVLAGATRLPAPAAADRSPLPATTPTDDEENPVAPLPQGDTP
jgi:penicillin-binding protein 2